MFKGLKGIPDEYLSVSIVSPVWAKTNPEKDDHAGWVFRNPTDPPC